MAAAQIVNPESGTGKTFWTKVDDRLKTAGVTAAQVQAAWVKQADIRPSQAFSQACPGLAGGAGGKSCNCCTSAFPT